MQKNRIAQLVAVLLLLLVVAWVTGVFDRDPSTIDVPTLEVQAAEADEITIQGPYAVDLSREGGLWMLKAPLSGRADTLAMTRLINTLESLTLNSVVSKNPERHATYGVDVESGRAITLRKEGTELASLVVSAQGPDFSTSYVRLEGEPVVYSASRITIPATLDALRDRALASVQPELVRSAQWTTPSGSYRLDYGDTGWMLGAEGGVPQPVDSVQVSAWIRRFAPLRLDGFLDDLTPDSLSVTHTVRIEQINGAVTEVFFEADEADLVGYAVGQPLVMRASAARQESLFPDPATLRGEN